MCAAPSRNLNSEMSDAASAAMDEDFLPFPHVAMGDHRLPRGEAGKRQGRSQYRIAPVRQGNNVVRVDADERRCRALIIRSDMTEDAIASVVSIHILANGDDFAREFMSKRHRAA